MTKEISDNPIRSSLLEITARFTTLFRENLNRAQEEQQQSPETNPLMTDPVSKSRDRDTRNNF